MITAIIATVAVLAVMYVVARLYPAPPPRPMTAEQIADMLWNDAVARMNDHIQAVANAIGTELIPTIRSTTDAINVLSDALVGDREPIIRMFDAVAEFHNERPTP